MQGLFDNLAASRSAPAKAFVFRARAGIFGSNAPKWSQLPAALTDSTDGPYKDADGKWVDDLTVASLEGVLEPST